MRVSGRLRHTIRPSPSLPSYLAVKSMAAPVIPAKDVIFASSVLCSSIPESSSFSNSSL